MKASKGEIIGRYYSYYCVGNSDLNEADDLLAPYDGIFDLNDSKYGWHLTSESFEFFGIYL